MATEENQNTDYSNASVHLTHHEHCKDRSLTTMQAQHPEQCHCS